MLLVGQQEGHPACKKLEWWGAGVVICLERGADLHMAQLMPLPLTVSCLVKSRLDCVCVCVCVWSVCGRLSVDTMLDHTDTADPVYVPYVMCT